MMRIRLACALVVWLCSWAAPGAGVASILGDEPTGERVPIPDSVVRSAQEFVASRLGAEFYDKNVTYAPDMSAGWEPVSNDTARGPEYTLTFHVRLSDCPSAGWHFRIDADSRGVILRDYYREFGLLDCARNPDDCRILCEGEALAIAGEHGLKAGLGGVEAWFEWWNMPNEYGPVWIFRSTLGVKGRSSWGQRFTIDASTGEIVESGTGAWRSRSAE